MRETTSERQVEGPAITMSEAGFSMFLDFVRDIANGKLAITGGEDDEKEVAKFLNGYEAHKTGASSGAKERTGRKSTTDWKGQYEALKAVMYGKGIMQLKHIQAAMSEAELWPSDTKQGCESMRRFMANYPGEVVNCRRGTYHWPTPDEIVLKFKEDIEGCNEHEK